MGFFNGSTTTTTTQTPYGPAAGHMNAALNNLGNQQYYNYGGPWYASQNPMMQGAGAMGYGMGMDFMNQGKNAFGAGMSGYQDQLSQMQNLGPQRFQYDQGTANAVMNQMSGGLTSQANLAGLLSSRNLDSQLGQLMGDAGTTGQFGTQLSSKLAGNAASANALSREALQGQIQNLYTNAAGTAANAGMAAGGKNMASAIGNQQALLGGYGNMANMGYKAGMGGLGAMRQAGMDQFGYDKYKTQAGLDQYKANLFGQQQFYNNQFNPAFQAANAFKTTNTTQKENMSGIGKLGAIAGLAGSIYGGFSGMGGMGGLGGMMSGLPGGMGGDIMGLFGQGNMGGGANIYNNPYYTGNF